MATDYVRPPGQVDAPLVVVVEVRSGVATVTTKPLGVTVIIRDYDVEGDEDDTDEACGTDIYAANTVITN